MNAVHAFPSHAQFSESGDRVVEATNGMSLRSYFVGQAVIGVLNDKRYSETGNEAACVYEVARYAGRLADAMMAESGHSVVTTTMLDLAREQLVKLRGVNAALLTSLKQIAQGHPDGNPAILHNIAKEAMALAEKEIQS